MARRAIGLALAAGCLAAALAGSGSASSGGQCSSVQKARRQAALAAYRASITPKRRAYFRHHASPKLRHAFLARQRAQLRKLRAAASCTVAVPVTAPAPAPPAPAPPPPPPVSVSYEFGNEVSAADRAWPEDVVAYAGSALQSLTGVALEPFKVFVYADPEGLATAFQRQAGLDASAVAVKAQQYRSGNVAAEAGSHGVFVYLGNSSWSRPDLLGRQKILAHEMFHLVEEQLEHDPSNCGSTPFDQVRACGPTWLIEGAAETVGYRVAEQRGYVDPAAYERDLEARVRGSSLSLRSLETYAGQSQPHAWDTMNLAAGHLAAIAPNGIKSFVDFWTAIGKGTEWHQAFQSAFEISVDQYYAAFDTFLRSL